MNKQEFLVNLQKVCTICKKFSLKDNNANILLYEINILMHIYYKWMENIEKKKNFADESWKLRYIIFR